MDKLILIFHYVSINNDIIALHNKSQPATTTEIVNEQQQQQQDDVLLNDQDIKIRKQQYKFSITISSIFAICCICCFICY